MNIVLHEKDIKDVKRLDDGLISFYVRTKAKAQAVYNCYNREGNIISDALQCENKSNYVYAIYHNQYKYCAVKLK